MYLGGSHSGPGWMGDGEVGGVRTTLEGSSVTLADGFVVRMG